VSGEASSYRRILWATSVVGGATLASLVIGLARNKAVALIGGPAAVGLLGIFSSVVSMAASITTLGIDTSGVRQVSQQVENAQAVATTKRAIWTLIWPLALLGCTATWIFREPLARFAAGDARYAAAIGALGIGVAASAVAAAQMAVLQGYGRVGDLARVRLWGSVLGTAGGISAVYALGVAGIVIAVVATPLSNCLLAMALGRKLPGSDWRRLFVGGLNHEWRTLITIGAVVTATNVVASLSQLWTRALVTQRLGLASAGLYHASWAITWVNLSLVLNAMAADYFPRVSKVAHEPRSMSEILNQQVHVALLLAGPALALVSVLAPLVLTILYSGAFSGSALLLRLLLVAGVLRMPIWALGYVLLARRAGPSYFLGEVAAGSIIPLTWLLLPSAGLVGAGIAAIFSGLISFFFYLVPVHRSHGVQLSAENGRTIISLFLVLTAVAILFELSTVAGATIGTVAALVLGWRCYRQLRSALAV
jgi:PST family polysaccharide transporter